MRGLIHIECPALDAIRGGKGHRFVDERLVADGFSDYSRHESYLTWLKSVSMWLTGDATGMARLPLEQRWQFAKCRKDTSNLGLLT